MDVAVGFRGEPAHGDAEIVQHRGFAEFGDRMHRIQPQPVEAVVAQPVQRVLDREGADLRAPDNRSRCPMGVCASVKKAGA